MHSGASRECANLARPLIPPGDREAHVIRRSTIGPIGLDLGAASIKMLQLTADGRAPRVVAAARCERPSAGVDPADDQARLREAIEQLLRKHAFHGRAVVACLGAGEYQMKNARLPRMSQDELASAVQFEAQERFDFAGAAAQVRHVPVGEVRHGNEIKEEVIIFAATDEVVNRRVAMLESLRLDPLALDIAPCATARCFVRFLRRAEDANSINVFLEVGYGTSTIIVTRGTDVSFVKIIDIGGRMFNEAVAKALGTSQREAADLRVRIMREGSGRRAADRAPVPDEIKAAAGDAVRPFIERLSRDVQLCMRYFAVTFRGHKPESVTLVGGEAHEPLLSSMIAEAIDVPCMVGNPLRGMEAPGRLGDRDQKTVQPAWATVAGLALRGLPWAKPLPGVEARQARERSEPADAPAAGA